MKNFEIEEGEQLLLGVEINDNDFLFEDSNNGTKCDEQIDNAIPSGIQSMDFGFDANNKIRYDKDDEEHASKIVYDYFNSDSEENKNHASNIVFDHFNSYSEMNKNYNNGDIEAINTNNVIKATAKSFDRQTFNHCNYLQNLGVKVYNYLYVWVIVKSYIIEVLMR